MQGKIGGKLCYPNGITTTEQGQTIIADGRNCRLLVLNTVTGEIINTQDLQECDGGVQPHLINSDKELLLWYKYQSKERIAHYEIK